MRQKSIVDNAKREAKAARAERGPNSAQLNQQLEESKAALRVRALKKIELLNFIIVKLARWFRSGRSLCSYFCFCPSSTYHLSSVYPNFDLYSVDDVFVVT